MNYMWHHLYVTLHNLFPPDYLSLSRSFFSIPQNLSLSLSFSPSLSASLSLSVDLFLFLFVSITLSILLSLFLSLPLSLPHYLSLSLNLSLYLSLSLSVCSILIISASLFYFLLNRYWWNTSRKAEWRIWINNRGFHVLFWLALSWWWWGKVRERACLVD